MSAPVVRVPGNGQCRRSSPAAPASVPSAAPPSPRGFMDRCPRPDRSSGPGGAAQRPSIAPTDDACVATVSQPSKTSRSRAARGRAMSVATSGWRRPVRREANAVRRGAGWAMVPLLTVSVVVGSGGCLASGDECCTRRLTSNLGARRTPGVMPSYRLPGLPEDEPRPAEYSPGWRRGCGSRGLPGGGCPLCPGMSDASGTPGAVRLRSPLTGLGGGWEVERDPVRGAAAGLPAAPHRRPCRATPGTLTGAQLPYLTDGLSSSAPSTGCVRRLADRASPPPNGVHNPPGREGAASARRRPWKRKLCHVTGTGQRG